MSGNGRYHDVILAIIRENGPQGVSDLQKRLDIPLSTIQKYLTKQQNYFKRNENRKWDLPENVSTESLDKIDRLRNIAAIQNLETQVNLALSQIEGALTVMSDLEPHIKTFKSVIDTLERPVATQAPKLDKHFQNIIDMCNIMERVTKEQKDRIPEQYITMLKNVDWLGLTIAKGTIFLQDTLGPNLANVMNGAEAELPDDIIITLKQYQKS